MHRGMALLLLKVGFFGLVSLFRLKIRANDEDLVQGVYLVLEAVGHVINHCPPIGLTWLIDSKRRHWSRAWEYRLFMGLMQFMATIVYMAQRYSLTTLALEPLGQFHLLSF